MAKPVYIICAESISQDSSTSLMSFFHVLEGFDLQISRITSESAKEPTFASEPTTVHLVCVWARDPDESPEQIYEWQLLLKRLDGTVVEQPCDEFVFTRPFHRIHAKVVLNIPASAENGTVEFSVRIRVKGTAEWLTQTYPLPVNVTHVDSDTDESVGDKSPATERAS